MMKVALYVRVSKRDMNNKNQLYALIKHADQMQWDYTIFKEEESTRKTRPVKYELMQKLRKKEFDAVCIWKLDRWARSLQELVTEIDELTNKGIDFIVLTQPIDTTNASGRLFLQILAAFAEFEREIIRERTIAGLERARAQGKKLGRPKKKRVIKQGGFSYRLDEKK